MHTDILNKDQLELLPFIKLFADTFYLVGGTAIALHLGHRRSIDFDLFSKTTFNHIHIKNKIYKTTTIEHTFSQGEGELTVLVNNVKITFFHYPFHIESTHKLQDVVQMPDLLTLGAMKAYALGRRAKWKDYVDLYYLLHTFSLKELMHKTNSIFANEFNEKVFRIQLGYFDDIDFSETIEYMAGFQKSDEEIKTYLQDISIS